MLGFNENLADVLCLEGFLGYFLIVRHTVLIELISQVLDILKDYDIGLVVYATEQSFEALTTLELNVDLVGKKF